MASILNPYIAFAGDARAAMEFYNDVFGGELSISTFGDYGDPSAPNADGVMHANLTTTAGFTLMASDLPPGMEVSPGNQISISVGGDAAEELRSYWEQLSEGGTVTMPLEKQVWGDEFGMVTDRFGIAWMINITGS